jgi:hypothetical protein
LYIIAKGNMRLCQDNMLREWAHFGSFPENVKEYKSLFFAVAKAKKIKGRVLQIPADHWDDHDFEQKHRDGSWMDSFGRCYSNNQETNCITVVDFSIVPVTVPN